MSLGLTTAHRPRCDCGCVPSVPSLHEMAELRAARKRELRAARERGEPAAPLPAPQGPPIDNTSRVAVSEPPLPPPPPPPKDDSITEHDLQRLRDLERERKTLVRELRQQRELRTAMLALHEPGTLHGAERRVELHLPPPRGVVEVVVAQDPSLAHGGVLWTSGLVLAQHVITRGDLRELNGQQETIRALELGCGVAALPALAAWFALGAEVLATDLEHVVPLASACLSRNIATLAHVAPQAAQLPRAAAYAWSDGTPPPGGPYDLVLAADLLYDATLHNALASALSVVLLAGRRSGLAILSYEVRDPDLEDQFFARLRARGLDVTHLSAVTSPTEAPGRGRICITEVRCSSGESGQSVTTPLVEDPSSKSLDEGLYL